MSNRQAGQHLLISSLALIVVYLHQWSGKLGLLKAVACISCGMHGEVKSGIGIVGWFDNVWSHSNYCKYAWSFLRLK